MKANPDFFGETPDFTTTGTDDGGNTDDMPAGPVDMIVPQGVTIHDIDTGVVPAGTAVTINNAVVVGVANNAGHTKKNLCKYKAWVQDASGAPDGIALFVEGGMCTPGTLDGGTAVCRCPFPPMSGTVLDQITTLGDVYTISGLASNFSPSTDGGLLPPQHEIDKPVLTKTGSGMPMAPTVISDSATIATFVANGSGFQACEGMLVSIKPAASGMMACPPGTSCSNGPYDKFHNFAFGGAVFSGDYSFSWDKTVVTTMAYSQIMGIAEPAFGGGVAPRQPSDFMP